MVYHLNPMQPRKIRIITKTPGRIVCIILQKEHLEPKRGVHTLTILLCRTNNDIHFLSR
jgi:hypothetical protein